MLHEPSNHIAVEDGCQVLRSCVLLRSPEVGRMAHRYNARVSIDLRLLVEHLQLSRLCRG